MRTRRSGTPSLEALPMGPKHRPKAKPVLENAGDQGASPLLSLAPELRNRIYEYCFNEVCEIPGNIAGNRKGLMMAPGLLLACKQIYAEALKIYYNKTEFHCSAISRIVNFLLRIGVQGGHGGDLTCVALNCPPRERTSGWSIRRTMLPEESAKRDLQKLHRILDKHRIVERAHICTGTVQLKYRAGDVIDFATFLRSVITWSLSDEGELVEISD